MDGGISTATTICPFSMKLEPGDDQLSLKSKKGETASLNLSKLIAKKSKPHSKGESVKECLVAAAGLREPDKGKIVL